MPAHEFPGATSRGPGPSQDVHNTGPPAPVAGVDEAWWRVVDRLALVFTDGGLTRMPARVFAYVLIDDDERYTARQLADALRVSPAAISGALQQLVSAGMLAREREPGNRADMYRIYDDDVWTRIMEQRGLAVERYESVLRVGATALAPSPGADRLYESAEYLSFAREAMNQAIVQWREHRRELSLDAPAQGADGYPGSRNPS